MNFRLETDRLILRVLDSSFALRTLEFYRENAAVFQPFESPYGETFLTEDFQRNLLAAEHKLTLRGNFLRYWIFSKDAPSVIIGTVSYRNIQPSPVNDCEIGYKVVPDFQNQGIATEMLSATIPILLNEYHMHRIHALVTAENIPSIKLLQKFGFEKEGTCRKSFYSTYGWQDVDLYALLAEEYKF